MDRSGRSVCLAVALLISTACGRSPEEARAAPAQYLAPESASGGVRLAWSEVMVMQDTTETRLCYAQTLYDPPSCYGGVVVVAGDISGLAGVERTSGDEFVLSGAYVELSVQPDSALHAAVIAPEGPAVPPADTASCPGGSPTGAAAIEQAYEELVREKEDRLADLRVIEVAPSASRLLVTAVYLSADLRSELCDLVRVPASLEAVATVVSDPTDG